jgi:hypothetical protein
MWPELVPSAVLDFVPQPAVTFPMLHSLTTRIAVDMAPKLLSMDAEGGRACA